MCEGGLVVAVPFVPSSPALRVVSSTLSLDYVLPSDWVHDLVSLCASE